MRPGYLPVDVFWGCPTSRRPPGRPRTQQKDCDSQLAEEHLGVSLEELVGVTGEEGGSSFHHPLQSSG